MTVLSRGIASDQVSRLKDQLQRVGWSQTASNSFDLNTEAAVRNFQQHTGLEIDGLVGKNTQAALQQAEPIDPKASPIISIIKSVPYFSQRDNEFVPSGTCNVTSLAMVMSYWGIQPSAGEQLEDQLFQELLEPDAQDYFHRNHLELKNQGYNPRNVHGMLGWLAKKHGLEHRFTDAATLLQIKGELDQQRPVITSGRFTASGHIIVLIGYTHSGFIVHDPWGDWEKGYSKRHQGQFLIYNYVDILPVLNGKYRAHFIKGKQ